MFCCLVLCLPSFQSFATPSPKGKGEMELEGVGFGVGVVFAPKADLSWSYAAAFEMGDLHGYDGYDGYELRIFTLWQLW